MGYFCCLVTTDCNPTMQKKAHKLGIKFKKIQSNKLFEILCCTWQQYIDRESYYPFPSYSSLSQFSINHKFKYFYLQVYPIFIHSVSQKLRLNFYILPFGFHWVSVIWFACIHFWSPVPNHSPHHSQNNLKTLICSSYRSF